ncbi:hypothetical protein [Streptomyces sp. NPDC002346]
MRAVAAGDAVERLVILGSVTALLKINIFRHRESAVLPDVFAVPRTGP